MRQGLSWVRRTLSRRCMPELAAIFIIAAILARSVWKHGLGLVVLGLACLGFIVLVLWYVNWIISTSRTKKQQ